MSDGLIGKFIYFWIFLLGGLIVAKFFGIADTVANMVMLSIALAITFILWNILRAKAQKNAAEAKAVSSSQKGDRNKKKKR